MTSTRDPHGWTRRRWLSTGFGTAAAFGFSRVAAAPAKRYQVAMTTAGDALHWYPSYVARAANLFADEGLDVEWIDVGSGTKQIASVMGGSALATPTGLQTALGAAAGGADLVTVCNLFDRIAIQLVLNNAALAKGGIQPGMPLDERVRRLKGMRIGVTGVGSTTDTVVRTLLVSRKLDPQTYVTIQPLGSPPAMQAALESGVIDGAAISAPFPEITEMKKLGRIVADTMTDEIPEMRNVPYSGMVTTRRTLQSQPEAIAAMVRALTRAMALTRQDGAKAGQLVRKLFPQTDPKLWDVIEPRYRAAAATTPVLTAAAYQRLVDWLNITASPPVKVSFAEFVDNRFALDSAKTVR